MARLYGPLPGSPPPLVSTADLAGLSASDVENSPVGELVGALSEERTGLIRYLDISIRGAEKHVLVPIGHARIDRESVPPRVRLRAATHDDLLSVPEFVEDDTAVSVGYQDQVLEAYGRLYYGSRYYAHPAYEHELLHGDESSVVGLEAGAEEDGLRPFSELGELRLPTRAPTLIGWRAVDATGDDVGTIRDLLVDTRGRRVRYVVLELDAQKRSTILPIGYVELGQDEEQASITGLTATDLALLPAYEPPLTRAEENRLHAAIEGRLSGDRYFQRADFQPRSGTL